MLSLGVLLSYGPRAGVFWDDEYVLNKTAYWTREGGYGPKPKKDAHRHFIQSIISEKSSNT